MADNSHECPNCGNLMKSNESSCRYCGSGNPSYKSIRAETIFSNFTSSSQTKSQSSSSSESKSGGVGNVNWLLAIVLLICCWPIGLIYIVLKMSSK